MKSRVFKVAVTVFAMVCAWSGAHTVSSAATLYAQPYDNVSPQVPSQVFTDTILPYSEWSTKSFDDFTVPTGPGWLVNGATIFGKEDPITGDPSQNIQVVLQFQTTPLPSFFDTKDPTYVGTEVNGNLVFTGLNVFLAPQTYWISGWVVRPEIPGGQWNWDQTTPVKGSEAYIQNPGMMLVPGAATAVPQSTVFGPPPLDLAFTITGVIVPEPTSLVPLALGMLAIAGVSWRQGIRIR